MGSRTPSARMMARRGIVERSALRMSKDIQDVTTWRRRLSADMRAPRGIAERSALRRRMPSADMRAPRGVAERRTLNADIEVHRGIAARTASANARSQDSLRSSRCLAVALGRRCRTRKCMRRDMRSGTLGPGLDQVRQLIRQLTEPRPRRTIGRRSLQESLAWKTTATKRGRPLALSSNARNIAQQPPRRHYLLRVVSPEQVQHHHHRRPPVRPRLLRSHRSRRGSPSGSSG